MATRPVKILNQVVGGEKFVVIAGPCSIESREQFMTAARGVQDAGATLLRGGIYKMRTDPKSFQGLGREAFEIIKEIRKETGMGLVSEVTDPRQISDLMDVVDAFQVGSRNMHNYYLLKELGQVGKPILLKRGFSGLIKEWILAAEYVVSAGNPNVILCERGIRTFETTTRNTLDLNAVAYVKAHTGFPVLVDPSHGTGLRELIAPMSWAAAAAGADGLLIEVHPEPKEAKSDGFQALSLNDFDILMVRLKRILAAMDRPI